VVVPLVLVAVVVVFLRERPEPPSGPPLEAIEAAAQDPCALFTSREIGVLVDALIVERQYQAAPPRHVCAYHGDSTSAGTVIEIGIVSPAGVRAERGRGFSTADLLTEVVQSAAAEPVPDLGDEAHYVALGAGELWARDGDLVVSATVIRDATEGDRAGAITLARATLGKVSAAR
jgi:hypothetical protein